MSTTTITNTDTFSHNDGRTKGFQLAEYDRSGRLQAQYIESLRENGKSRIDVLVSLPFDSLVT
jgi:hypothetical protein